MIRSTAREHLGPRTYSRFLIAGVFVLLFSVPMLVFMVRAAPETVFSRRTIVPLPIFPSSVDLYPSFAAGGFEANRWLWQVLEDLLWVVYGVVYYLALASATAAIGLLVAGAVGVADPTEVGRTIRRTFELRIVRILLGLFAVTGVAIFFPAVFLVALEVVLVVAVWLPLTVVLGMLWRRLDVRRDGIRVLVGYPLMFAVLVVPVVAASIASPTITPHFVSITGDLLGSVSVSSIPGGDAMISRLSVVPRSIAYAGFWTVATIVVGGVVGVLTEGFVWLLPRLLDRVVLVVRRGIRVVRWLR